MCYIRRQPQTVFNSQCCLFMCATKSPPSSQIVKTAVPHSTIYSFFEKICNKNKSSYIFTPYSFKKSVFLGILTNFLDSCRPHYRVTKHKYLIEPLTYSQMITILRQICKRSEIKYTSKIIYANSSYTILYYFEIVSEFNDIVNP